ncbi:MAG TPA: endolytic transglycosylase MltG [Geobacteraceae bacterium]|nr:endolytic transglycosylase MltG [Geobacteraceae bacterium]
MKRLSLPVKLQLSKKSAKIAVIAVVLTLVFGIPFIRYGIFVKFSAGSGENRVILDVKEGFTLTKIALELEKLRVISSEELFVVYAKFQGSEGNIKAGPYLFDDGMTPPVILRKLLAGDVYVRRFAVPEGYSMYQIAELLERRGIVGREKFLEQCTDPSLLAELGINASSVEGYLYPCTYDINPATTAEALVREMVFQFRKHYLRNFEAKVKALGMSSREVLTLASMVEKEAVESCERPMIASVFLNRLRRNMPLQSDPTAVYKVRAFAGRVSKKDIMLDSPYNTYRIKGLPPGPIGNPGPDAIEAVLNPARTNYLYFVAKMDGTHCFSVTLDEHNRAVERFLKSRHVPIEARDLLPSRKSG